MGNSTSTEDIDSKHEPEDVGNSTEQLSLVNEGIDDHISVSEDKVRDSSIPPKFNPSQLQGLSDLPIGACKQVNGYKEEDIKCDRCKSELIEHVFMDGSGPLYHCFSDSCISKCKVCDTKITTENGYSYDICKECVPKVVFKYERLLKGKYFDLLKDGDACVRCERTPSSNNALYYLNWEDDDILNESILLCSECYNKTIEVECKCDEEDLYRCDRCKELLELIEHTGFLLSGLDHEEYIDYIYSDRSDPKYSDVKTEHDYFKLSKDDNSPNTGSAFD